MNVIQCTVHLPFTLFYLDDIVIFKKPEAHINHVKHAWILFFDGGVTIKLKKCEFFSNIKNYPGHVIHPEQLVVLQYIIDALAISRSQ